MGPGAKVGVLAAALAAAIACAWLVVSSVGIDEENTATADTAAPPAAVPPKTEPPRAARVREKPDAATSPRATDVRLTGTVVDDQGAPVAGAWVRAFRGAHLAGEATSDAQGRFAVSSGAPPAHDGVSVGVSAGLGANRRGWFVYSLMEDAPAEDDIGDIALEDAIALLARVEDANGPVTGAHVFVGTFFGAVFAETTTDAHGVARFDATPATDAWLFAYAPGRGRARGEIPDGRDPKVPLVLTLSARTVRVSVVRVPESAPAAGERISARLVTTADGRRLFSEFVPPLDLPPTGDTGIVSVEDVAAGDPVEFGRAPPAVEPEAWRYTGQFTRPVVAEAHEIEVRLEVPSGRMLRWPIVAGEVPTPAEGTLVALERGISGTLPTGPRHLVVADGFLVGAGFAEGEIRGVARAPDGSMAQLDRAGADARFVRPRSVEVTVRDADGRPVEGVVLSLRDAASREVADDRTSGADGRAVFTGIEPGLGVLDFSARTVAPSDVRWVASVDVDAGDARVEVRLGRPQEIVLRVTTDGEPRLPPAWSVLVDGTIRTDPRVVEPSEVRVLATEAAPGAPVRVVLRADGFSDCAADVTCDAARAPVAVDMPLSSGATIAAEFRPTPRASGLYAQAVLQQMGPRAWEPCRDRPLVRPARDEPGGARRFEHVPPGRYRLGCAAGDFASAPVDVGATRDTVPLRLDLSRGGPVRVRVVGPDGESVPDAWVTIEEADGDWLMPHGVDWNSPIVAGNASAAGGAAAERVIIVPGDRPVRLVARHATMLPDPESGSVAVTEPTNDVATLRLVEGPVIEFGFASAPGERPIAAACCTVRFYRGAAFGEPVGEVVANFDGTRFRAGGVRPGRYSLWILGPSNALVPFANVDLHDGVNDLGLIRPRPGCAVRVRVTVSPGQSAPRVSVTVTRLDAPNIVSSTTSQGQAEIALFGFPPGRYEVSVTAASNRAPRAIVRTVELDGEHDVVLDYAPR